MTTRESLLADRCSITREYPASPLPSLSARRQTWDLFLLRSQVSYDKDHVGPRAIGKRERPHDNDRRLPPIVAGDRLRRAARRII
jgi:hypothetical protein